MLYLTCTMIPRVDLAHYGVSHAKDWVSVDCGTSYILSHLYNINAIKQSACFVFNPIVVDHFASLFSYTSSGRGQTP